MAKKTYLEIQKQIEQLQEEAERLRREEASDVLSRIKEAIAVYGFSAADLGFGRKAGRVAAVSKPGAKKTRGVAKKGAASAPKFKDDQGNVWSGRGPRPTWFKAALEAGKSPDELLAK
ncbi:MULTISPECIES: H-NS family nucleoid-associated regulatory protein [Variovorax]|jgi:DNA-binding protein H-NS|uniref:H-NS histone family protein n=1 Tax=Variovorax TaxID=34072 RepID=UPI00086B7EFE|nr:MULTISPECIES: H-NS histone family protein [Variovorax]MBN8752844.1 H-NS histone family protein [Variovorax sp.]ODU16879.1 MAG: hypothetical protein ABS94_12215 [Variovorax sp. SCN 67-85]ODV23498.1 MAG: hypothetical protein ABT25_18415 [Variovorax sp. SCN 67-20]OJZ15248.1 MAG: hypothetical protein BGP22_20720 [Variovorax sp. 67-131]UKI07982.1 H-NS histone family protein [Variovorax paradoxus]